MLDNLSRKIMLSVADNETIRGFVTRYGMADANSFARRFIAGESLDEAVEASKALNEKKIKVTLDLLGENVTNKEQSLAARDTFLTLLDTISRTGVDSNISLKLTQLGLDLNNDICIQNMEAIVERAKEYNNFVRIDMEGSDYTQKTIDIFKHLYQKAPKNVGIVLQSYLYRTEYDVRDIAGMDARIRLCKGAYREPEIVSFQKKKMTDLNFIRCFEHLIQHANYPAIATHDSAIIEHVKNYVSEHKINQESFEFQMLYGVRRELQLQLVNEGYNVRIYVPFGTEWFPYFSRRLGERIGNVMFILKALYLESGDEKNAI